MSTENKQKAQAAVSAKDGDSQGGQAPVGGGEVRISADALPKAKKRNAALSVPNFADKQETVDIVIAKCKKFLSTYTAQPARTKFVDDCNEADKMFRFTSSQTKQDQNKTPDEIDCIPGTFYHDVTLISAHESSVLFHSPRPPVKYTPYPEASEAQRAIAQSISEKRNRLWAWTVETDSMFEKMEETILFANKYGTQFVGMEWLRRTRRMRERRPVDPANPDSPIRWQTIEEVEQHPVFTRYDMNRVWFDANIPDLRDQSCIIVRSFPTYSDIIASQRDGQYMNVEKVTAVHEYQNESPGEMEADRQTNADEGSDTSTRTYLIDRFDVYLRCPINDSGEWDEEGTIPDWHWVTLAGNLDSGDIVCLRLSPNPYDDDEWPIPYRLVHSHPDDKNAFNMGFYHIERSNYQETKTAEDQWFYNKALVNNRPPLIEKGTLITTDLPWNPQRPLYYEPGKRQTIDWPDIPSNTNDSVQFLTYLDDRRRKQTFTDKAVTGEAFGARTSASEVRMAYEKSEKPGEMKMRFMANQLLLWAAKKVPSLYRQFAPKDMTIAVAGRGYMDEIKPAQLWGRYIVKVTAVDEWEDDTIRRLEQDKMLQVTLPALVAKGGDRALKIIAKIYRDRRVLTEDDFDDVFGITTGDLNAREQAEEENIGFVAGQYDEPQEGENHDVHIVEHDQAEAYFRLIPDISPDAFTMLRAHKQATQALKAKEGAAMLGMKAGAPGLAQQPVEAGPQAGVGMELGAPTGLPSAETAPMNEGQAMQNVLGAEGGGMLA